MSMPHVSTPISICSADGYLKEQARSVSRRKCLGAMSEPNGIKSTSVAA